MKFKKIHIIINPASGQDEPILSYLNQAFGDTGIEWDVSITKKDTDAATLAQSLIGKVDVIAVYGGDGSVSEVAQVLRGQATPLAIIPGGTANVVSKELGIPQNTIEAISLLKQDTAEVVSIDMGMVNEEPFMIRVNLGIMADMIVEADRELKNKVGQLAYGITALQTMIKSEPSKYTMTIDGQPVTEEGVALTVTNCGSIGIGNYSFLPDISIHDGLLDVLLLRQAKLGTVLRLAGTTLLQTDSEVLKHWKCREIRITLDHSQKAILDDCEKEVQSLHIQVLPGALNVVVPPRSTL